MNYAAHDQENFSAQDQTTARYARCIQISKRVNWDIDEDIVRGRSFDISEKFLPDGLSKVEEQTTLSDDEKRYLSQIQGRTYANIFGLVERFINAKILEVGQDHYFGDQVALEAVVRFSNEELKHQELFRRIEGMCAEVMPEGYSFTPDANEVASVVMTKSTWAVLLLTLDIELFTQSHYRESIEPTEGLSPLYKDVFLYHWKEESQHAIIDELELIRHDADLAADEQDQGVTDFIDLVAAVDGILQGQAKADVAYFANTCGRALANDEVETVEDGVLAAYRWQYIFSGAQHPHFGEVLGGLINADQGARIQAALESLA